MSITLYYATQGNILTFGFFIKKNFWKQYTV
jgi:hypothetical protein